MWQSGRSKHGCWSNAGFYWLELTPAFRLPWPQHFHLRLERGIESGLSLLGNHRMNTTRPQPPAPITVLFLYCELSNPVECSRLIAGPFKCLNRTTKPPSKDKQFAHINRLHFAHRMPCLHLLRVRLLAFIFWGLTIPRSIGLPNLGTAL